MSEDNKARVRRYFEETLSKGNMSYVDEIAEGAMAEGLKRSAAGLRSFERGGFRPHSPTSTT